MTNLDYEQFERCNGINPVSQNQIGMNRLSIVTGVMAVMMIAVAAIILERRLPTKSP